MCYAIPGKITSIDNKFVTVEYFGEKKKAYNEFDNLNIGDYIYAQGGYVIQVIPEKEAISILNTWKETFFELQDLDLRLSKVDLQNKINDKYFLTILDKALEYKNISDNEFLYLLETNDKSKLELLYKTANFIRQKHLSNSCCVHGIIEFSNYCKKGCIYCGISYHNNNLLRYRMNTDEISEVAYKAIEEYGFKAIVLQSGEDSEYSIKQLSNVIKNIKQKSSVLIFISIGEIGKEGLKELYKAGARGLLMRFETSNQELYKKLHPNQSLETRLQHLEEAYKMGYLIITGSLIGVPGQTNNDILNDIKLTKKLNAEMYSFGPFIPHPSTPLANNKISSNDEILKSIAISRIIDPYNAKILITTAFETIDSKAREQGLLSGANSVMLNITPDNFKKHYSLYPNRAHINENIPLQITNTISLLKNIGRAPTDLGF